MAGYARTVCYLPLREDLSAAQQTMNAQKRAIEAIRPGDLLVGASQDIDHAVTAAARAFTEGPWPAMTARERARRPAATRRAPRRTSGSSPT
jgi:acyl-CoA reductase-like NAD-dependent aldehyde dehydrogenase